MIKKTVLTAQKSGKLEVDPIEVTCSIRIASQRNRRDPFANFFNSSLYFTNCSSFDTGVL